MKICISTVYDANNCGAFLQAYALKKILENMGHEVYHIKFRTNRERKHSYFNYGNISKIKYMKRHLGFTGKNYKIYKNAVSEFTEIYPIDTKNMDLLIIGSDELWNVTNENVLKTIKISSYTCKRKAAFSVSCGNSTAGDIVKYKRLTDSIKDLQYIFVRDVYTKTAVESITDKETGLVCDPTLLLSREQYPKKKYKKMKDRYLLYYGYWSDENTRKNIRKYAEKNDLKVLAVGIDNYWCDMSIPCHPLDFIKYIEDAEAVVTATFHGTIFSFLCEKNVVCLDYGSNKLKDLAKRLDVENRIIYDNCGYDQFEKLLKQRIDYGTVNQNIEKMREESLQSLEKIINQK